jgi:hypothetical protein
VQKRKILPLHRKSNNGRPTRSPSLYRLSYLDSGEHSEKGPQSFGPKCCFDDDDDDDDIEVKLSVCLVKWGSGVIAPSILNLEGKWM